MSCDCIHEFSSLLQKIDPEVTLDTGFKVMGSRSVEFVAVYCRVPRRVKGQVRYNADGARSEKLRLVIPNYCPICGERYPWQGQEEGENKEGAKKEGAVDESEMG